MSHGRITAMLPLVSEQAREEIAKAKVDDENKVLDLISQDPKITQEKIATAMGWKLHSGEPNRMRAKRCIDALVKDKAVKKTRGVIRITPEGKKTLKGEQAEAEKDGA